MSGGKEATATSKDAYHFLSLGHVNATPRYARKWLTQRRANWGNILKTSFGWPPVAGGKFIAWRHFCKAIGRGGLSSLRGLAGAP
jgi:hypothetical protein